MKNNLALFAEFSEFNGALFSFSLEIILICRPMSKPYVEFKCIVIYEYR